MSDSVKTLVGKIRKSVLGESVDEMVAVKLAETEKTTLEAIQEAHRHWAQVAPGAVSVISVPNSTWVSAVESYNPRQRRGTFAVQMTEVREAPQPKLRDDVPMPVGERPDFKADIPDAEYFKLAAEVGYRPYDLLKEQLKERFLNFIAELGLYVFDNKKVEEFLNSKFGAPFETEYNRTTFWSWVSLDGKGGGNHAVMYMKAIPYPVLQTVANIKREFPEALFFVSDQRTETSYKDPFLQVYIVSNGIHVGPFIVERWDEPTFRG